MHHLQQSSGPLERQGGVISAKCCFSRKKHGKYSLVSFYSKPAVLLSGYRKFNQEAIKGRNSNYATKEKRCNPVMHSGAINTVGIFSFCPDNKSKHYFHVFTSFGAE